METCTIPELAAELRGLPLRANFLSAPSVISAARFPLGGNESAGLLENGNRNIHTVRHP